MNYSLGNQWKLKKKTTYHAELKKAKEVSWPFHQVSCSSVQLFLCDACLGLKQINYGDIFFNLWMDEQQRRRNQPKNWKTCQNNILVTKDHTGLRVNRYICNGLWMHSNIYTTCFLSIAMEEKQNQSIHPISSLCSARCCFLSDNTMFTDLATCHVVSSPQS